MAKIRIEATPEELGDKVLEIATSVLETLVGLDPTVDEVVHTLKHGDVSAVPSLKDPKLRGAQLKLREDYAEKMNELSAEIQQILQTG